MSTSAAGTSPAVIWEFGGFASQCALAIALVLMFGGFAGAATDPASPPPLGRLVDAGGYRVHLYCTGTGSPAVMVVGGAFSFDWGLIQPEVAKFTRICTYDSSGTAWSDPYRSVDVEREKPGPVCADRVAEIHHVLNNAGVTGPYVLVGFSIGGLVGRLYTHNHPKDVAGMVIVDHAFIDVGSDGAPAPPVSSKRAGSESSGDSAPVLISSTPITLGLEDDWNFSKLPQRNRDMHAWAMSTHPVRPTAETAAECSAVVESETRGEPFPLGDRPLIVIRTSNELPGYGHLQAKLLLLSRNSKQVVAQNSSHMVIIDEPEVVVSGIRKVVEAVRNGTRLK